MSFRALALPLLATTLAGCSALKGKSDAKSDDTDEDTATENATSSDTGTDSNTATDGDGETSTRSDLPSQVPTGEWLLRGLSKEGAKSTAVLDAAAATTTILHVSPTGLAIAFDFSQWSYFGNTGTELARLQLDATKLAELKQKFGADLALLELTDDLVNADYDAALASAKAKCPDCTSSYGGDVEAYATGYADGGKKAEVFWDSTKIVPDGESAPKLERAKAAHLAVLEWRDYVLEHGEGIFPQALAAVQAEQKKHAGVLGIFEAKHCYLHHEDMGQYVEPAEIVCSAYKAGADEDAEPTSMATVKLPDLKAGTVTFSLDAP